MKPLDVDMILKLAREHEILLTVEEGSIGGFGSHVMQMLAEYGMLDGGLRMRSMVLPDEISRPRLAERDVCPRRPRRQKHRRQGVRGAGQDFKTETVKLA